MGIKVKSQCLRCGKQEEKINTTGKYCSNKCQALYQTEKKIDKWLREGKWENSGKQIPGWMKRYIREQTGCCSVCGIKEWNGAPIVLEVDHIDGIWFNNSPDNLRALCPNCHSQTETFKNKNNGNGRKLNCPSS